MLKFFKKDTERPSCSHEIVGIIYLEDKIYDRAIDNDDLEDIPTVNKVGYCTKCGKILDIKRVDYSEHIPDSWHVIENSNELPVLILRQ